MSSRKLLTFPKGFLWGSATSAYQIEGAVNEDGRGVSIWDTFSHTPGKTHKGENGDIASDHYHRWQEDLELMKEIGLQAYRFSIAWPRIQPDGQGSANPAGLDFYDRLIDALLESGIEPIPTLYHWDLPQALQDTGGWTNREIVARFAEYARIVAARYGDRVKKWITHNEPAVTSYIGHLFGEHAPGIQDPFAAGKVVHHLLLSHGHAVDAIRENAGQDVQVGIALSLSPVYPASDVEEDVEAAKRVDVLMNQMFLHPLFCGEYPLEAVALAGAFFPEMDPEDLKFISRPIDFLGVNYYSRAVVKHNPGLPIIEADMVSPVGNEYSQMWEIYPEGLYDLLQQIHKKYSPKEILITENGIPVADGVDFDGRVRDTRRISYLREHLGQAHRAIQDGVPLTGYLVWSLLDNFEWAYGYKMRFGLVYVDFDDQKRIIKDSGYWLANVIKNNGVEAGEQ